eukprot:gb/GECG01005748.1/.p1 GENE.gb/GECG01005748.1/~~gb/GECG01005748.1/.p1  ORF type:complete len:159 (+),score=23.78 gb/GECG01005748.1/:1-477(+)
MSAREDQTPMEEPIASTAEDASGAQTLSLPDTRDTDVEERSTGQQQVSSTAAEAAPTVTETEWAEAFSGTVDGVAESVPHLKRNTEYALKKVSDAISLQIRGTSDELKTLSYVHKIVTSSMAELGDNISNIHAHVTQLNTRSMLQTSCLNSLTLPSAS